MPCFWELLDPLKRVYYLQQKSISKPRLFVIVILHSLVKLLLSYVEKTNLHLLLMFGQNFFERDGFERACVIGHDAILDFLAPKGVDFLIRVIQAGKELIDNKSLIYVREGQRSIKNFFGIGTHSWFRIIAAVVGASQIKLCLVNQATFPDGIRARYAP